MKAILFDMDGTIIDSSEGITKSVQYALQHYGIEESDLEKLRPFIGPPLTQSFAKFYNFDEKTAKEAITVFRERYRPIGIYECKPYPYIREAITALKEKGYLIGIASSKPEAFCKKILTHHNLIDLFDEIVGSTEDGRIDTKTEVLEELFRRWKDMDPKELCLVGDTLYDVEGANNFGMSSIAVTFGFGNVEEMLANGAYGAVDSFLELPDMVARLEEDLNNGRK